MLAREFWPGGTPREGLKLDLLVVGPHPDDAEIGAGGVLLKAAAAGKVCGIVDLTAGEMGTGGTPEIRWAESCAAAEVLKVAWRAQLGLPDCRVQDDFDSRVRLAEQICRFRPEVVLAPYYDLPPGRGLGHTDHIAAGYLVSHAVNFAHLYKMPYDFEPWYPRALYYYFLPPELKPSFVVNVTEHFDGWMASIMCHVSQFGRPEQNASIRDWFGPNAARWGRQAGGKYAQAFYSDWPLRLDGPLEAAGMG
jgi:bacillithiol biosynthesis deacetylase BshB1